MGRVKLTLPDCYQHEFVYQLNADDMNYADHLDNARVLGLAHLGRTEFLKKFDYTELDVEGVSTIMADAAIIYKSEGHKGNDIRIRIGIGEISGSGFELYYQMHNLTKKQDLAIVKTASVFFDYKESKVFRTPEAFRQRFSG